jgi:hypothetical protein
MNNSLVGKNFRTIKGEKCHIVNEFKDGVDDIVTYKKWSKVGRCWNYYTDCMEVFMVQFECGAKWQQ